MIEAFMEISLIHEDNGHVRVLCDSQFSHICDLSPLLIKEKKDEEQLLQDPVAYGKRLYQALFAPCTLAQSAVEVCPERLLLVALDAATDAIPWEYLSGPDGFLVTACHFLRGLPAEQRQAPALPGGDALHILALPSHPLTATLDSLNINGEWERLKEIIEDVPYAVTLERTRPATSERLRQLLANQRGRVLHFMGHGGQNEQEAFLYFEKSNGDLDLVTTRRLVQRMRGSVFLATLNACVSATPGRTALSNLAASLVRQNIPYALGMRLNITDEDARTFSRIFYSELARGSSVEEALLQTRLTLGDGPRPWVVGVPVLYTSLRTAAPGFLCREGKPAVQAHEQQCELTALPRVMGDFQGRLDELKRLGDDLVGDRRPPIISIYGAGGQGKTTLAREAVERFSWAWPGGVWSTTLEHVPERATLVSDLARFLGLTPQSILDPQELERQVFAHLSGRRRTLLVLDNAEALVDAARAQDKKALRLAQFLQQLPGPSVSLLVTSRVLLGWANEACYALDGLAPGEGARLLCQCASRRRGEIEHLAAQNLSQQLAGHPLSLRLLGSAFHASHRSFQEFLHEYEANLLTAEDMYQSLDHRHRSLNACIETSVRYLDADLRILFAKLQIFHAPFPAAVAVSILASEPETEDEHLSSQIVQHLEILTRRSLLTRRQFSLRDGILTLYYILPAMRPYLEHHLSGLLDRQALLARLGIVYARWTQALYPLLDTDSALVILAQQMRKDMERGLQFVPDDQRSSYLLSYARIVRRLSNPQPALQMLEEALEIVQDQKQPIAGQVLTDIAEVYRSTGYPQKAQDFYEQGLAALHEISDHEGEAVALGNLALFYQQTGRMQEALSLYEQILAMREQSGKHEADDVTFNNMGMLYQAQGQSQKALILYEQALSIRRASGDRAGLAITLSNLAVVYQSMGDRQRALALYQEALPALREMGDLPFLAKTLNNLGVLYQERGNRQEARRLFAEALPVRQEIGDRMGEAITLNNLAMLYQEAGDMQEALALHERLLPVRRKVEDRVGECATLNNLALIYAKTGQAQRALASYQQALVILQQVHDPANEALVLRNLAALRQEMGAHQEAVQCYTRALSLVREIGKSQSEVQILSDLALLAQQTGQWSQALLHYTQALALLHAAGDHSAVASILQHMALLHAQHGQPEKALSLYEQAAAFLRGTESQPDLAALLHAMANIQYISGRYKEAAGLYTQSLSLYRALGDRAGVATTLSNLATVSRTSGLLQEALAFSQKALSTHRSLGNRDGEATVLTGMAQTYQRLKQPLQALPLYAQALQIRCELADSSGEAIVLHGLGATLGEVGRYEEALACVVQSLALEQKNGHRAGEATGLVGQAVLLYEHLHQPQQALLALEKACTILAEAGIDHDAAGHSLLDLQRSCANRRSGRPLHAEGGMS
jgi:tetratricopeptide (TPR) repeat protein